MIRKDKKPPRTMRRPRRRGAGGGTPSGVSDASARSPNFAAGLTPQAPRYGTPHCGLPYGFREAARGRVPVFRYQIKNHPQGVVLICITLNQPIRAYYFTRLYTICSSRLFFSALLGAISFSLNLPFYTFIHGFIVFQNVSTDPPLSINTRRALSTLD